MCKEPWSLISLENMACNIGWPLPPSPPLKKSHQNPSNIDHFLEKFLFSPALWIITSWICKCVVEGGIGNIALCFTSLHFNDRCNIDMHWGFYCGSESCLLESIQMTRQTGNYLPVARYKRIWKGLTKEILTQCNTPCHHFLMVDMQFQKLSTFDDMCSVCKRQ